MSFHLTNKAKADLIDIAHYTDEQWGRQQRNKYLAQIDAVFHDLGDMPHQGTACDDIRRGYRKFRVGKHIIFYRLIEASHIEIVRILHGSMDVKSRMSTDETVD